MTLRQISSVKHHRTIMNLDGEADRLDYITGYEGFLHDPSWPGATTELDQAENFPPESFHLDNSAFGAGGLFGTPHPLDTSDLCFQGASYEMAGANGPPMQSMFGDHDLGTYSFPASVTSLDGFSDAMHALSGTTSPGNGLSQGTGTPDAQIHDAQSWTWESSPGVTDFTTSASAPDVNVGLGSASLTQHQQPAPARRTGNGLPRRRSRYLVSRPAERSSPIQMPAAREMDPMQRWQESPPEDEPASLTAIMNAMDEMPARDSPRASLGARPTEAFQHHRQSRSIGSVDLSASSADSVCSSAGRSTSQSSRSRSRRPKGRVVKSKVKPWNDTKPRVFCCTFCCDRFRSKYDWVRHEKSLHLSLEAWYCAPLGPSVFSETTGQNHCAWCSIPNPSREHLRDEHHIEECQNLSKSSRSFRRKDHLVQHLRHVHQVNTVPCIDSWKTEMKNITSRCGFCDQRLHDWEERIEHLSDHFRSGYTMKDWQGDHGFPSAVTAQLRNAFPPYLIGAESESLIPFSSTSADVRDHYAQMSSRVHVPKEAETSGPEVAPAGASGDLVKSQFDSFLGNFTRHLGQFAREQMQKGVIPTDEMFQQEARKVIYDCEDAWDQTIADNPEWLSTFRQLHCGEKQSGSGSNG